MTLCRSATAPQAPDIPATPHTLQNAFASLICPGVLHSGANSAGLATTIALHRARLIATALVRHLLRGPAAFGDDLPRPCEP